MTATETTITKTRYAELLATGEYVDLATAKKGDRVIITELHGYRLVQERPFDCRGWSKDPRTGEYHGGCKCGTCDGETVYYPGTVWQRIYWADNSIDLGVRCDDGQLRTHQLTPPSGDASY
jgi:hypothetical protein